MFCPNCGQERLSMETSFCSRCGFLLTGTAEIMKAGGVLGVSQKEGKLSRIWRNRGFKQGLFILLLSVILVPLSTMIAIGLRVGPFLPTLVMILLVGGGVLRMIYALMFESPERSVQEAPTLLTGQTDRQPALPPQQAMPINAYGPPSTGSWRDTNDLEPISVTEGTTKLLENEDRI